MRYQIQPTLFLSSSTSPVSARSELDDHLLPLVPALGPSATLTMSSPPKRAFFWSVIVGPDLTPKPTVRKRRWRDRSPSSSSSASSLLSSPVRRSFIEVAHREASPRTAKCSKMKDVLDLNARERTSRPPPLPVAPPPVEEGWQHAWRRRPHHQANRGHLEEPHAIHDQRKGPPEFLLDKCFNCLSSTHRHSECHLPPHCFHYKGLNHLARDCKRPRLPCKLSYGRSVEPLSRPHESINSWTNRQD